MSRVVRLAMVMALTASVLFAAAPGAQSHDPSTGHYWAKWKPYEECHLFIFFNCHTHNRGALDDPVNTYIYGNGWNNEKVTRVLEGEANINGTPTDEPFDFSYGGTAAYRAECVNDSKYEDHNTMVWTADRWGTDVLAYTVGCFFEDGLYDKYFNFEIRFNSFYAQDRSENSNTSFCFTLGNCNEWDFASTALHELMHGTGWGDHLPDPSTICPDQFGDAGNIRNVMCKFLNEGTEVRSLRTHDSHTFQTAYTP